MLFRIHSNQLLRSRASGLIESERFGLLVDMATKGHELPQLAKRSLMRAIVEVSFVLSDDDRKEQYFSQILQPLENRFKAVICSADFPRTYHQEEIRAQFMDILEAFIGIRDPGQYFEISNSFSVWRFCLPFKMPVEPDITLCTILIY